MNALSRTDRETIISNVVRTVESKHFDPGFDKQRWRSTVERETAPLMETANDQDFAAALSDLVHSFGTPDAGFFHESTRKKVPKGLAARFQYCQPNECAPGLTPPSDAGDVMISKLMEWDGSRSPNFQARLASI